MEHCKQKNYTLQTKLQHATNKKETVKKMEHCKQKNYTLQTKLQHATNKKETVKKWNTANKRITRCKQNSRKLQTTFSSPEAELLLVSTKNCDLSPRFLAWSNSGSERLCKHNRLRPEPIKFGRLESEHAQSGGKSVNRRLPVPEVVPLRTGMYKQKKKYCARRMM